MVTRSMATEALLAHFYVMRDERAKAIASAKRVGANVEVDGITLVQRAISTGHFVIGRELRILGAVVTIEDRNAVKENISRYRHLLNNGFSWNENALRSIRQKVEEMEGFLAPIRRVRR